MRVIMEKGKRLKNLKEKLPRKTDGFNLGLNEEKKIKEEGLEYIQNQGGIYNARTNSVSFPLEIEWFD